jgi:hypothetical protein
VGKAALLGRVPAIGLSTRCAVDGGHGAERHGMSRNIRQAPLPTLRMTFTMSDQQGEDTMRMVPVAIALSAAFIATTASAQVQGVNLNGPWVCTVNCLGAPGSPAYITQNGSELNVVNDAGQPSRGWIDYPGRIWVQQANQGAIYSPDGMRIQFDGGTIWQRPPLVRPRGRLR